VLASLALYFLGEIMYKNKLISLLLVSSLGLSSSVGYVMRHTKKEKEKKRISSNTEKEETKSSFIPGIVKKEKIERFPNGNAKTYKSNTDFEININWKGVLLVLGVVATLLILKYRKKFNFYKIFKRKHV